MPEQNEGVAKPPGTPRGRCTEAGKHASHVWKYLGKFNRWCDGRWKRS